MQTSKECVIKAIEFDYPDRMPVSTEIGEIFEEDKEFPGIFLKQFPTDILQVINFSTSYCDGKKGFDEYGCEWRNFGHTQGEVVVNPLKDWKNFDKWKENIPDFKDDNRYEGVEEIRTENPDKFIIGGIGLMMTNLIHFRGFSNFMMDFYSGKEKLEKLTDILYQGARDSIEKYSGLGLDAVITWEDWGLQDRLMISPDLWRSFFKEKMRDLVDFVHKKKMKYVFHCCGYILDIIEDFIDIGVDVLNLDQQNNMGLKNLEKFKGRICFFNPADIQFMSNNDDYESIRRYCAEMVDRLSDRSGGFIYHAYSQPGSVEIIHSSIIEEARAFLSYNHYKK